MAVSIMGRGFKFNGKSLNQDEVANYINKKYQVLHSRCNGKTVAVIVPHKRRRPKACRPKLRLMTLEEWLLSHPTNDVNPERPVDVKKTVTIGPALVKKMQEPLLVVSTHKETKEEKKSVENGDESQTVHYRKGAVYTRYRCRNQTNFEGDEFRPDSHVVVVDGYCLDQKELARFWSLQETKTRDGLIYRAFVIASKNLPLSGDPDDPTKNVPFDAGARVERYFREPYTNRYLDPNAVRQLLSLRNRGQFFRLKKVRDMALGRKVEQGGAYGIFPIYTAVSFCPS